MQDERSAMHLGFAKEANTYATRRRLPRSAVLVIALALCAAVTLTGLQMAKAGASGIPPSADGYVNSDRPTQSYGESLMLRARRSDPENTIYLRFDLGTKRGHRAVLRMYSSKESETGFVVHAVDDDDWTEAKLTFGDAPAFHDAGIESGSYRASQVVSIDITALAQDKPRLALAITPVGSDLISLASRETSKGPRLHVDDDTTARH